MANNKQYLVTWATDIFDVSSPIEAARKAMAHIVNEQSIAHVFEVKEDGATEWITVDLDELDGKVI